MRYTVILRRKLMIMRHNAEPIEEFITEVYHDLSEEVAYAYDDAFPDATVEIMPTSIYLRNQRGKTEYELVTSGQGWNKSEAKKIHEQQRMKAHHRAIAASKKKKKTQGASKIMDASYEDVVNDMVENDEFED